METGIDNYPYSYAPRPEESLEIPFWAETISKLREKIAPFRFRLAAREIIKTLRLQGNERILEIGSGLGLLGKEIINEMRKKGKGINHQYVGIDLAFNPLAESKKNQISPVQADAVALPFANETFDVVISTDVLEHIPDAEKVIEEMRRVLKVGGRAFVVIADPSEARFRKVTDHIERTRGGTDVPFWEKLFEEHGFSILKVKSEKYRTRDWRRIFNLPFLVKLKDIPGFACAFNPVCRPGVYVLEKPQLTNKNQQNKR